MFIISPSSVRLIGFSAAILLVLFQSTTATADLIGNDTLKLVILIHRHGDRSPIDTYPLDPYQKPYYWPYGMGQLTNTGKRQMFAVGKYLAKRYSGFLGMSPREVSVRSSASDRCLESVAMLLAGLYPPVSRWQWNDDLGTMWQPFPIQTVPFENDGMLNPFSKCKNAEKEIDRIYSSNQVQQYYKKMKPLLEQVGNNTGLEKVDLIKGEEIFDALMIEKLHNYTLPAWVTDSVYEQLKDVMIKTFYFDAMTRTIQRYRAGLLLEDILHKLKHHDGKRLFIYSSHDSLLTVFLMALDAYNGIPAPYATTIMLELHENDVHKSYLKAHYFNETESETVYPLTLPNCLQDKNGLWNSSVCTVNNFHLSVRDLIPEDWDEECQSAEPIILDEY